MDTKGNNKGSQGILDKHPGPWRNDALKDVIYDANGNIVLTNTLGMRLAFDGTRTPEKLAFFLAAPDTKRERDELLTFVRDFIKCDGAPQKWGKPGSLLDRAAAIVERIDRAEAPLTKGPVK